MSCSSSNFGLITKCIDLFSKCVCFFTDHKQRVSGTAGSRESRSAPTVPIFNVLPKLTWHHLPAPTVPGGVPWPLQPQDHCREGAQHGVNKHSPAPSRCPWCNPGAAKTAPAAQCDGGVCVCGSPLCPPPPGWAHRGFAAVSNVCAACGSRESREDLVWGWAGARRPPKEGEVGFRSRLGAAEMRFGLQQRKRSAQLFIFFSFFFFLFFLLLSTVSMGTWKRHGVMHSRREALGPQPCCAFSIMLRVGQVMLWLAPEEGFWGVGWAPWVTWGVGLWAVTPSSSTLSNWVFLYLLPT